MKILTTNLGLIKECNYYGSYSCEIIDDSIIDLVEITAYLKIMDKNWIDMHRTSNEYIKGVESFLDLAFAHTLDSKVIICSCLNAML